MWNDPKGHDIVKLMDENNVSSSSNTGYGQTLLTIEGNQVSASQ